MLQQPFSLSIEQGQPGDADEPVQPGSDQRDQRMGCGNRDLDRSCGCPAGRDGLLNDGESTRAGVDLGLDGARSPKFRHTLDPRTGLPPLLQKVTLPLCTAPIKGEKCAPDQTPSKTRRAVQRQASCIPRKEMITNVIIR